MNIRKLREQFPNEAACREFIESIIWRNGRICPNCHGNKSWLLKGKTSRPGLYECGKCKCQFTVTTRTPMHSTKLPLWLWIQAMYLISYSSKGISSVVLSRLIGISQKSAWKLGHAIRALMTTENLMSTLLDGIVELDEKYLGGKPRYQEGITHKRGKGTDKQAILIAAERGGQVRTELISSDKRDELEPIIERFVDKQSHLMTDKSRSYPKIGENYFDHSSVNHSIKEYARGDVHNNTAESFGSMLERARIGVFHKMSDRHLHRYLHEAEFRWTHRVEVKNKSGTKAKKRRWKPRPAIEMLTIMFEGIVGLQLRRSKNGGIFDLNLAGAECRHVA
jgi:hypothetical protein